MSESEVICNISHKPKILELETTAIIDNLENECSVKTNFNRYFKDEVRTKIEDFSNWFNSIARLYLLRCGPQESEIFIYLLLNLKKKLKFAIAEINKSVSSHKQKYTCSVCSEEIEIEPWQNTWTVLQNHPHFEETYTQSYDFSLNFDDTENNGETSTSGSDITEDLNKLTLLEKTEQPKPPENGLNNFKFNFVITYDPKVEEALYPDALTVAARRRDNLPEYTVQRCGVGRGNCLLCPCTLQSRGRVYKISPFIVKNHVAGQRHLKYASSEVNLGALKQYHEFWRSQDPNYQAHQVHFVPDISAAHTIWCQLCQETMNYVCVIKHIKDSTHKSKVLKIFSTPEGKLNEFYLLDMQVAVYDVVVNNTNKEGPKEGKNEVKQKPNGSAAPKCVFVKFVPDTSGLMVAPRYKDHIRFFQRNLHLVNCTLCKSVFENDWMIIRNHIMTLQHKQLSGVTIPKFHFFCEICNVQLKDEDAWEDHFHKGPNRHDSIAPVRKQKVCEYECKTCLVVIYGDELSLSRHISSRSAKSGRMKEIKLPFTVKKLFKSKKFIEDESVRLQMEAKQVFEYQDKMNECCEDLERALAGIYPNCKAYAFGSRVSGLGNNQSDLDVFMDTGDMYLGERHQDSQSQEQFVKKVSKSLKSCKDDFSYVVPIPAARTPIVKLRHNYTNMDCDVSFRHGLGVENTKFLRFCIDLQPITQPFILLLKRWSDYCKLNEHITNYGLALMGIFYLQTGRYLLSVKTVRNYNPTKSLIIDGWETLNYTVPTEKMKEFVTPYKGSIKQLLREFFFYFSKFDYANQVICPLLGHTIPKLLFNERPNENLPPEMKSYIQRIQSENGEQFRGLTPFCIQDPFDLSHNLAKACQHSTISKLKALCTLTYEFLDTIE